MSAFVNNPFALLSDDADVQAAFVPKKAPVVPEPKQHTKQDSERKSHDRDARSARTPRGRGGRVSAPRTPREPNNTDFTGGEGAPSDRPPRAPRGERAGRGAPRLDGRPKRREFDRHSGTGRHDGEKKEVAGSSWGDAVESASVTQDQSAEQAWPVNDNPDDQFNSASASAADPIPEEKLPVAAVEDKTKSYAEYEKEINARKSALRAKPARKANEGVKDASILKVEVLSKKDIAEEAGSLALLLAGNKQKKKAERKQPKDRHVITDLLKFQFAAESPRRPERGDRSNRVPRGSYSRGSQNPAPAVNIDDTIAFPSLA